MDENDYTDAQLAEGANKRDIIADWWGPRNNMKRPAVLTSYRKTMSWKRPSEEEKGFGYLDLYANADGSLSVTGKELTIGGRGSKEVMLELTPEKTIELRDLLLFMHPISKP